MKIPVTHRYQSTINFADENRHAESVFANQDTPIWCSVLMEDGVLVKMSGKDAVVSVIAAGNRLASAMNALPDTLCLKWARPARQDLWFRLSLTAGPQQPFPYIKGDDEAFRRPEEQASYLVSAPTSRGRKTTQTRAGLQLRDMAVVTVGEREGAVEAWLFVANLFKKFKDVAEAGINPDTNPVEFHDNTEAVIEANEQAVRAIELPRLRECARDLALLGAFAFPGTLDDATCNKITTFSFYMRNAQAELRNLFVIDRSKAILVAGQTPNAVVPILTLIGLEKFRAARAARAAGAGGSGAARLPLPAAEAPEEPPNV